MALKSAYFIHIERLYELVFYTSHVVCAAGIAIERYVASNNNEEMIKYDFH